MISKIWKHLCLLSIGGWSYCVVELLWRHHTHWTMFLLGGICFVLIGEVNEFFRWDSSILAQMLLAAALVTIAELLIGAVVNLLLGWEVWNYTGLCYQFAGQISLVYFNLWFLLSLPAILVDDLIRWQWFGEERPRYKLL